MKTSRVTRWILPILAAVAFCVGTGAAQAALSEGFNGTGWGSSYGTYTVNGWVLTSVFRETSNKYEGAAAIRFSSTGSRSIVSPENAAGIGTVSFWHRRWSASDGTVNFSVYVSSDGSTWGTAIATGSSTSDTYTQFSQAVNDAAAKYVRIEVTSGKRWLVDLAEVSDGPSGPAAPSVETAAASGIDTTSATANGDVTDDGGDTVTERGVCYKTTSGVTIADNPLAAAAGGTGEFSVDLSGLDINQIYYFRAYAENGVDTTLAANELNFTTLANVPAAPTVDNPTATTLDVAVNANGNPASTEFAIQRTSDSQYLQADGTFGASEDWQTATEWDTTAATGLSPETEYFFQVKARNGASVETAFGTAASASTTAAATGIWINPMSAGTPMGSYYLGDVLGEWFVNFEIGQENWNYAQIGLGTALDGTGYSWGEAGWYQDGDWPNKRVRRNLSGFQFTSAANYYVICQAKANAEDDYTSKSGNDWGNSTLYPPADLASAYFAVSALNDAADPSAEPNDADPTGALDLNWTPNAQSHNVMVVRKAAAAAWTEPAPGTTYSVSDSLGDGTVVYVGSGTSATDSGLTEDSTYDYKFYSVNNGYYAAGVTAQGETLPCEPDAPTGLYASETNETSFVAAWTASDRATGYRLDVSTEEQFGVSSYAADLFISEYIEGTSNNKAVEIFNGTASAVDLSAGGYTLRVYANGGASPATINLTGTVAPGGVHVVAHSSANAAILAQADQTTGSLTHNGNDQIALAKSSVNIDVIGTIGLNVTNLIDVTKVRKSAISQGVTTYDVAEWTDYAVDTTSYLGSHDYAGGSTPSFVAGYENLAVAGTSQLVAGLDDNTIYYFRVRAEGEGGCPSANSETASVTTLESVGGPQTIDFPAIGDQVATNVVVLSATASSGLDVAFAVLSGPADLDEDGVTLTFTGAGEVSVVASQAGGGGWDPADPVTNTFGVTKALATVTLGDLAQAYDGTPRAASVETAPEGLTVDVTYDGEATVPTDPGQYEVVATVVDDLYQGSDTETLTVSVASPASFSGVSAGMDAVELSFTPNAAGNPVVIVVNATGVFEDPSGAPVVGEALAGGTVLYVGTVSPQTHADLESCTPYYYKAWSYVGGFYSDGLAGSANTDALAAPTGLGAVPDYTSFVASWDASTGATGYRLDVSTEADFQSSGNGGLFISEVADPYDAANAKFVELYNASGAPIDFGTSTWYIWRQANGGSWGNVQLSGTIAAGEAFVVAYSQTTYENTFGEAADQYSGIISGNGNDGYFLVQGGDAMTMGTVVDAYGVIDQDGTGYAWAYLDKNAVRNADVAEPSATWTASEWTLPAGTANAAEMTPGAHVCTGDTTPSFVAGYEDLAVAGTSQIVSGLAEGVTYYFRVRAESAGCESADSATASTTTLEHLALVLSQTAVNVRENGEGRFFVRLNKDPGASLAVSVSRSAGDESIVLQGRTNWAFNTNNWDTWQSVTLAQGDDANVAGEAATFTVAMTGVDPVAVEAATLDDDLGENLALASGGTAASSTYPCRAALLIDGVHTVRTNYGYVVCTSVPPGTITLDLKGTTAVSRVRLLVWDWTPLNHRYKIESSLDGSAWTTLIDASAEDHRGWEDWIVDSVSARYLRFVGVSSTQIDDAVSVAELEVYGTRALPSLIEVSKAAVNVREAGEGRFFVRLTQDPIVSTVVAVSRSAGSESLAVQNGAHWAFNSANWNIWQPVTLAQAADANAVNEEATFQVAMLGSEPQTVTATALDDDLGENLALAAGGSGITGTYASRTALLIDGVHAVSTNYGHAMCSTTPKGTMTLDLKAVATVSRVRLLTWDWVNLGHRYALESSTDGVNWTPLADATAADRNGWDDWAVADVEMRYLRFTAEATTQIQDALSVAELEVYGSRPLPELIEVSKPTVNVREGGEGRFFVRLAQNPGASTVVSVERSAGSESIAIASRTSWTFNSANWNIWQPVTLTAAADENADNETATIRIAMAGAAAATVAATALDVDVGENLALASGGATIAGVRASRPGQLIDGVHAVSTNYGTAVWTTVPAGSITLDLQGARTVSRVRLLNWDWTQRSQRYVLESSLDGSTWTPLADASGSDRSGWDDWAVADQSIRYLRLTAVTNSASTAVVVPELEVYGSSAPVGRRAAVAPAGGSVVEESEPVAVLTSEGPEDETGWNALDGDDDTAWVGQKAGGGYLVVEYQPTLTLSGLEVDVTGASLADAQVLTSLDAQTWQPLPEDLEANPVSLNFLWVVFPDDGSGAVPEVIEIRPNP